MELTVNLPTAPAISLQTIPPDQYDAWVPKGAFLPSYRKVAQTIRNRVLHGDYALKPIPSERHLAGELGVNYMTVRRGLQMLEEEGLLFRDPNGRKRVKPLKQGVKKYLNYAFIMPTLTSHAIELWRSAMEKAAAATGAKVRPILLMRWEDPILLDVLEGFDGIFLIPVPEPIPEAIAARLRDAQHKVVVVEQDYSRFGLPSLRIFPPVFVQRLLDHLAARGHSRIGCFNTQKTDTEVAERIGQWRLWMSAHGYTGRLINESVESHGDPMLHAYEVMAKMLSGSSRPEETAWCFTTAPAAIGAMCAMIDRGLQPGRDVAVCAANGEGWAMMSNPPLTALEAVDPVPFVSCCMDWMRSGEHWQGPLLMEPAHVPLFIRESTQPGAGRGLPPTGLRAATLHPETKSSVSRSSG